MNKKTIEATEKNIIALCASNSSSVASLLFLLI